MNEISLKVKEQICIEFNDACSRGDLECLKAIVDSLSEHPLELQSLYSKSVDTLSVVLRNGHLAVANFLTCSPLLPHHINPFFNEGRPLFAALSYGHKDFIKSYLESRFYYSKNSNPIGKKSNTKTLEQKVCNKLLIDCITKGDREMAEYLLLSPLIKVHANCNKDFYNFFLTATRAMIDGVAPMFDLILSKNNSHPVNLDKHYPSIEITFFEMLAFPDVSSAIISSFDKTDNWASIERLYTYLHLNGRAPVLDALIAPYKEKRELAVLLPAANSNNIKIKI